MFVCFPEGTFWPIILRSSNNTIKIGISALLQKHQTGNCAILKVIIWAKILIILWAKFVHRKNAHLGPDNHL